MTTTTNAAGNGRRRPTLSDQIDRLDATLDGLAEGLNEAVADAVKAAVGAAVREAVQATLAEVLTHPDVLARLAAAPPPPQPSTPPPVPRPAGPGVWERLGGLGRGVAGACAALWARCRSLARFKYELLAALGAGTTAAAAAWFAGPWLSAVLGGVGGFATTAAVCGWLSLRRTLLLAAERAA